MAPTSSATSTARRWRWACSPSSCSAPAGTVPTISLAFLGLVTIAGVAQIVATSLMIHAFSLRNYAVGTVYSKTETVFVALFATFIAHEPLKPSAPGSASWSAWAAWRS